MTPAELGDLVDQSLWSKQVVVWMGTRQGLDQLLHGHPQRTIDILELIPEDESWPTDREERADWLRLRLDEAVKALRPHGDGRVILRVRNAAILARLGTGLGPFFDWFAGSTTMSILEVDPVKPVRLPDSVAGTIRVDFDWLADRLRACLSRPEYLCVEN
jgi:hypothetical protein